MAYRSSKRVEEWKNFKKMVKKYKKNYSLIKKNSRDYIKKSETMESNELGQETKTASY